MAQIINLTGNEEVIDFKLGNLSLVFNATDAKSEALSKKAEELKEKADKLEGEDEWKNRKVIKELLDDFFAVMFDKDTPLAIYQACGENTWTYLKVFLQISDGLVEVKKKQENDEIFKKYLAE